MNTAAEDVKDMLEAESVLGLVFKQNLFVGREPIIGNNCVTVYDTPGRPPVLTLSGDAYHYDTIQIRIRNQDYQTAFDMSHKIMNLLHGSTGASWNGTLYTLITCQSAPALLDWDDQNRVRFIINFETQRRKED